MEKSNKLTRSILTNKIKSDHRTLKQWPEGDRPREKLYSKGSSSLSNAELLAILLRTGTGNKTAVDIGIELLANNSLHFLSDKNISELTSIKGIGKIKALTLVAAFELGRRLMSEPSAKSSQILTPKDVGEIYIPKLQHLKQEEFYVLLLNNRKIIIREILVSKGTLHATLVDPQQVFKEAIIYSAASIILIHNHPSGNPEPSREDINLTRQLLQASKIIGIPIDDHLIIAGDSYTSFADRGLFNL